MNQLPAIKDYYKRRINKCSQLYIAVPNDVERIGTLLTVIDEIDDLITDDLLSAGGVVNSVGNKVRAIINGADNG